MTKSEELHMKARGVKDCDKWLDQRLKETKQELEMYEDTLGELI